MEIRDLVSNSRVFVVKALFAKMWAALENRQTIEVYRTINGVSQTIQIIGDEEALADYKRDLVPLWMVQYWYQ